MFSNHNMLEIKDLTAGYDKLEILHGVNLNVQPGEIVALIGPNGAGKSTILKSIYNLCDIHAGKLVFCDKNITSLSAHMLISEGISFVPQGRPVFSQLSVRENLEMGTFIFRDPELTRRSIADVYRKFPIFKDKERTSAANLSGGQQQLLAIARALIQNPKLLLLDEPSLGLAPKIINEIFDKILEIRQSGVSVLIVEQNARQAVAIADRTYVLEGGQNAMTGGKEIIHHPRIRDIYLGGEVKL